MGHPVSRFRPQQRVLWILGDTFNSSQQEKILAFLVKNTIIFLYETSDISMLLCSQDHKKLFLVVGSDRTGKAASLFKPDSILIMHLYIVYP